MIFMVGYIYKIEGKDVVDRWSSTVVLNRKSKTNLYFEELEIIWNGEKEEPGKIWDPRIKYLENNKDYSFIEVGPKDAHPEYFL